MDIFPHWLSEQREHLFERIEHDQLPHALLFHGPPGTGRRLLALSVIGRVLGFDAAGLEAAGSAAVASGPLIDPELAPAHPDFTVAQPPPDKRVIQIEQIRQLIEVLHLTSHQSGYKVALINPAQALTRHAANSLLKTLEEPPGRTVIVLITDSLSRLPATIVSRCQRIRIGLPSAAQAQQWLQARDPAADWGSILAIAGGAPLTALHYHEEEIPARVARFERDMDALEAGQNSPTAVAKAWANADPEVCLNWLYRRISGEILDGCQGLAAQAGAKTGNRDLQKGPEKLNMERAFADLTYIGELRRLQGSGLNGELQLSGILTRWYGRHAAG